MMEPRNTARPGPGRRVRNKLRRTVLGLAAVALAVGAAACSDAPSAPSAQGARPNASLLGGTLNLLDGVVTVLTSPLRAKALVRDVAIAEQQASVVVGPLGGVIALPGAGLTVVVPANAVSASTRITVTAPAGRGVWYEFAPHGIQFARPLQVTQDLRGTNYSSLLSPTLKAAYFKDGTRDDATNTALVTELVSTTLDLLKTKVTFPVKHFSGYMISWGFADGESAESAF